MSCYILQKQVINLRTGATRWVDVAVQPDNACPSCCDPAGKLLNRTKVTLPDCTTPFVGPDNKPYRERTKRIYADGNCGTSVEYSYSLPCQQVEKTITIKRDANLSPFCKTYLFFTSLIGQEREETINFEPRQVSIITGTYKIRATQFLCSNETVKVFSLLATGDRGALLWQSGQPSAQVVIDSNTTGFYLETA